MKLNAKLSSAARANHCNYASHPKRQALADPQTLAVKTSIFAPILHPIGRPIHLVTLKKMAMKDLIFSHFR